MKGKHNPLTRNMKKGVGNWMKGKHNPITWNMKKGIGNWMKGTLKQSLNSKYEERRRITNKMKPKATLELEIEGI